MSKGKVSLVTKQFLEPGTYNLGGGSIIQYIRNVFEAEHHHIFQSLRSTVPWEQRDIVVLGKTVLQPRLTSYFASDSCLQYTYSGATLKPHEWTSCPALMEIRARLEELVMPFNSCLLNRYRDGNDSLGWHSDNEPLYGQQPTIASVSFGMGRDFILRRNADHSEKIYVTLGSGDILIMKGSVQQLWQHTVPKRKNVVDERISLTFRNVQQPEGGRMD